LSLASTSYSMITQNAGLQAQRPRHRRAPGEVGTDEEKR
jgi:hypothetical protein